MFSTFNLKSGVVARPTTSLTLVLTGFMTFVNFTTSTSIIKAKLIPIHIVHNVTGFR